MAKIVSAAQASPVRMYQKLEPAGTKWHLHGYAALAGCVLLMMFYTVIAGWLLLYCVKMARGDFVGLDAAGVNGEFGSLMGQPGSMTLFMAIVVVVCMGVCSLGLQNGVEKITKVMMICLLAVLVVLVLVVLVGAVRVNRGLSSPGTITAFLTYTSQFSKPFNEITAITTQIQNAAASARRIFGLLDEREQQPEPSDAVALHDAQGSVAFRDVSFSYSKEKPLIRHFSFTAAPGTTVAIVGPTGAGKTTLVNLLMRFYELDGGVIEVDGRDITTLTRDSLRRSFGMVLQETWLFDGTVAENIAYGRPNATMDEITAAAKAAYAHSFIKRLPEGYQTMIEGGGANLSAGQKQLLTIARAMLADRRLQEAEHLLEHFHGKYSIGEIGRKCGFPDSNYFCTVFRKRTGFSPREFIRRHEADESESERNGDDG